MTATDLSRTRRDVARKRPANAVSRRNSPKVIDGTARPSRSVSLQALKFLAYFWMALLFGGLLLSLTGYYTS